MNKKSISVLLLIFITQIISLNIHASSNQDQNQEQNIDFKELSQMNYSNEENNFASNLQQSAIEQNIDNIRKMMDLPGFDPRLKDEVLNPRNQLQIFVSSSMPVKMLQEYARSAAKYDGVLVFRGFPGGSISKMHDFVYQMQKEIPDFSMQIDDESFRAFKVDKVPAIVLSKEENIFANNLDDSDKFNSDRLRQDQYDLVFGAISLKAVLELFAKEGDMANEARELLR